MGKQIIRKYLFSVFATFKTILFKMFWLLCVECVSSIHGCYRHFSICWNPHVLLVCGVISITFCDYDRCCCLAAERILMSQIARDLAGLFADKKSSRAVRLNWLIINWLTWYDGTSACLVSFIHLSYSIVCGAASLNVWTEGSCFSCMWWRLYRNLHEICSRHSD